MTRFEKALVYALFVLAGISMLLTGRRIEALEQQVKALETNLAAELCVEGCQWGDMGGHDQAERAIAGPPMPIFGSFVRKQKNEIVSPAAGPQKNTRTATFTAFAYCACSKCCGRWSQYGLTASGTTPQQGRTVAVDPDVIPLGTQLTIDDNAGYIAEDTGSGIAGHTLDVYFDRHEDALQWGVRKVEVAWTE